MLVRVSTVLVVLTLVGAPRADEWLGRDKALHFGASAVIASGGYALTTALTDDRRYAFAAGFGLALGAGAAKETWDALGHGDPSWKDFTWDVIGTLAGLAFAYGVDRLVRPTPSDPRAAISAPPKAGLVPAIDCRLSTVDCRLTLRF